MMATWPTAGSFDSGENEGYKAQSRLGREGFEVVAHSGIVGDLSELGDGLETTERRWRSPAAKEEDDEVASDAGRLASRGSS